MLTGQGRGHLPRRQPGHFHLRPPACHSPAFPSSGSLLINLSHLTSQASSAPSPLCPQCPQGTFPFLSISELLGSGSSTSISHLRGKEENPATVPGGSHSSGLEQECDTRTHHTSPTSPGTHIAHTDTVHPHRTANHMPTHSLSSCQYHRKLHTTLVRDS